MSTDKYGERLLTNGLMILMCVATVVAVGGCASRQTDDPPDLAERSSASSMLTIYYLQIKTALTPQ